MSDLTTGAVIICDDVRREITGKDILVGVYSGGVNVPQLPAVIGLAVWFEIRPKNKGKLNIDVKLDLPNDGQPPPTVHISADVTELNQVALFTPPANCLIQREGEIRLSIRESGRPKWIILKRLKVRYQPPAVIPSSASA